MEGWKSLSEHPPLVGGYAFGEKESAYVEILLEDGRIKTGWYNDQFGWDGWCISDDALKTLQGWRYADCPNCAKEDGTTNNQETDGGLPGEEVPE